MQIYSFVGDDIHPNWVVAVETFSTKKKPSRYQEVETCFHVPHLMHWENTTHIHRCTSILRALKRYVTDDANKLCKFRSQ